MTVMQEDNVSGLICPKCGWNIITTKIDDIMLDTQLYQLFVLKNEHINRNIIKNIGDELYLHQAKYCYKK